MRFLLCPLFAVAAVLALAADSPLSELGNLTATAILGWYAWHTSTKTIPQLVDDFRGELATERAQQRADREAFLHGAHLVIHHAGDQRGEMIRRLHHG